MQTFRTKFTTDVSPHRRAMGEFRAQTCAAMQEARNQLVSLGALSFGSIGAKDLLKDIIMLGGKMQQTRTAFEVLLGSAEKGRRAIEKLVQFADVTPFDNPENQISRDTVAVLRCRNTSKKYVVLKDLSILKRRLQHIEMFRQYNLDYADVLGLMNAAYQRNKLDITVFWPKETFDETHPQDPGYKA